MKTFQRPKDEKGFVLFGSILLMMAILAFSIPFIKSLMEESRSAVQHQKKSDAYSVAEAGIDRGKWMLQSATSTWIAASSGVIIPGYNDDVVYTEANGGQYRILFTSGPANRQVTIVVQGRDPRSDERRAIRTVVENQGIPGPLLSRGNITLQDNFFIHWGPVMSQGDIILADALAANRRYPRKYARQVVRSLVAPARDANGTAVPNDNGSTDDWFSRYPVPNLPRLDFVALRNSAAASGTLNCYGKFAGYHANQRANVTQIPYRTDPAVGGKDMFWHQGGPPTYRERVINGGLQRWRIAASTDIVGAVATPPHYTYNQARWPTAIGPVAPADWNTGSNGAHTTTGFPFTQIPCQAQYNCLDADTDCASLPQAAADRVVEGFGFDPRWNSNLVWYWDGQPGVAADQVSIYDAGDRGTFIIRGPALVGGDDIDDLATALPGMAAGLMPVPTEAWREYQWIDQAGGLQYPGDGGLRVVNPTYAPTPSNARIQLPIITPAGGDEDFWLGSDIALTGLMYVGGDLNIAWAPEIYGALWVDGAISVNTDDLAAVFYNANLQLPVLDVFLVTRSWVEMPPAW